MKKFLMFVAVGVMGSMGAMAQTNASLGSLTNALAAGGVSSNTVSAIGAVANSLFDAEPYVKNGGILFEAGALKLGSSWGAFADIQLPINTNSWQLTYGTCIGYISNRVYSATLNVTIGTQVSIPGATNLPFIGKYIQPVYAFAESGPGYNFQAHQVVAQYMGGFKYAQPIGDYTVGVSYALGGISDLGNKLQEFSVFAAIPLH